MIGAISFSNSKLKASSFGEHSCLRLAVKRLNQQAVDEFRYPKPKLACNRDRKLRQVNLSQSSKLQRDTQLLFAVTNLCAHTSFLASYLTSSFSCFLGTHLVQSPVLFAELIRTLIGSRGLMALSVLLDSSGGSLGLLSIHVVEPLSVPNSPKSARRNWPRGCRRIPPRAMKSATGNASSAPIA